MRSGRWLVGEVGTAFGVLALLLFTLLAPVHATASLRAELGDPAAAILCAVDAGQTLPLKGSPVPLCDLCLAVQAGHAAGPEGAAAAIASVEFAIGTGWPRLADQRRTLPFVRTADARAPPIA